MQLTIFVSFALAMAVDCAWANIICPTMCTMDYTPVCALSPSTGLLKTFSNSCQMVLENCREGCDYQVKSYGECPSDDDCPTVCTMEYRPVCALSPSTGLLKTFSNSCQMAVENCREGWDYQVTSFGECPGGDDCPTVCTKEYNPVCGRSPSTGHVKTFANPCLMALENCKEGSDYDVISSSACPAEYCPDPRLCPHVYIPVCGQSQITGDLKTFGSSCAMNVENCRQGTDYHEILPTKCPGDIVI